MMRRQFVRSLLALACAGGLLQALPAAAQKYPDRPVRIIVPFAVGGPADVFARFIAQRLPDQVGGTFVIENKPGAGAVIGTDQVAKSPPDGYTLLLMSNTHTVNETLLANKPYDLMRDFVGIAPINYSDLVLVAHPSVGITNVRDLVKRAKEHPGKLTYASSGTGTPYHMAGELFKAMTDTKILHIPYRGSSGARTDVLGGQVDMMFDAVTTMTENIKAGKVKAIATTGTRRSAVLPEVPTVEESGVKGYEATIWLGLMAPRGTPPAIVNRLNEAITKIVNEPDLRQNWARQGAVPLAMNPQEFDKYLRADIQKWAKVIKTANIKAE